MKDEIFWQEYINTEIPHILELPSPWNELEAFQKLLIMRCFRPEKLIPAIEKFVAGKKT